MRPAWQHERRFGAIKINTKQLEKMHQTDRDLEAVITAWPELPEALRAGIVAMVKATGAK